MTDEDLRALYRYIDHLGVAYEDRLVALQRSDAPGTCTSVGQEACAVGVVEALDRRDRILTNHRSAGHLLARGAGHGGSLHISAADLGMVLTSTIVGAELSLAPGVALAQKLDRGAPGGIVAVFFGDGAACEGIFHEALDLAVQWALPILFVCEAAQAATAGAWGASTTKNWGPCWCMRRASRWSCPPRLRTSPDCCARPSATTIR